MLSAASGQRCILICRASAVLHASGHNVERQRSITPVTTPSRDRPQGETSGSDQRPSRNLAEAAMDFDIQNELRTLKQEASWERGDRNARTLVEQGGLRLVLTALKSRASL